ncbi:MAG: sigma-70 family RNA polymerase sigma factor [Candidatus Aminicenantes bacterium]|nr:sigma-70 family RNA polymerase sigma factor [Candidatus Aminicenantes bacterium]NIM77226.1 sigma-70 family RNA polymerase sigma factor [Candidatus Aminicenantes bacterium]NIN16522.1 sigma-70 family RNA polymerase sigma factor [Candidatus Aminicenantes bacterium]NIN40382.1 sigma-70 family RNA polymerase sigma factor [Candidatus Aminicenantes bacterium]NIN83202.1 sigma-70 family RNA polymerase sigma factor [Candidatus Aminicenantes bacterium]
MSDKAFVLSKEQAEKIFKDKQTYIKRSIRKKIAIYEPLEFKTAYQGFTKWVQNEEFNVFRNMPENCTVDVFLDELIKNFLIENAYYALSERYIQRRMMNKLGILDSNDIRLLEIVDFIIEGIERNELGRLKMFEERAKFKTFLSTVISSLLMDFWRKKYQKEKHVTKYEPEFEELFYEPQKDPLETLIHMESEETKDKAAEFLPRILDKLDAEEKLAIKMKYEKGMKISAIAKTLDRTRFKTEKFVKQIEMSISKEILSEIKKRR